MSRFAPGAKLHVKVEVGRMQRYSKKVEKGSERAVKATSIWLRDEIMKSLEGQGTGRRYRRYPGGPMYRASSPGRPPARRMGGLARSINWRYNGVLGRLLAGGPSAIVYSSSKYAPHLEYGTVRMAPRPFMRPAARRAKRILEAAVRDVVAFP